MTVDFDLATIVDSDGDEHPAFRFTGVNLDVATRIEDAVLIGSLEELDHESYSAIMQLVEKLVKEHTVPVQA